MRMEGLRYAFNDDGSAATLEEFFGLYEAHVQTPEQLGSTYASARLKAQPLWTVRPVSKPYVLKKSAKEDETTDSSA